MVSYYIRWVTTSWTYSITSPIPQLAWTEIGIEIQVMNRTATPTSALLPVVEELVAGEHQVQPRVVQSTVLVGDVITTQLRHLPVLRIINVKP